MNPPSDTNKPTPEEYSGAARDLESPLPANWCEALLTLIASRVALVRLEAKEAAAEGSKVAIRLIAAVICVFFTWALLLAGVIAAVSKATGVPWYWIAMAASGIHLIAAIILARSAKTERPPAFPVTRAEFQKDREWIENFQKTPKSGA